MEVQIKPFTKALKRKYDPKKARESTERAVAVADENLESKEHDDEDEEEGETDVKYLKESPCVGFATIMRWKTNNTVDLNCFLGYFILI